MWRAHWSNIHPSHRCRGAKSFVDDLGLGRGVVLSRAATTLRSIETKPFDWEICPLWTGISPVRATGLERDRVGCSASTPRPNWLASSSSGLARLGCHRPTGGSAESGWPPAGSRCFLLGHCWFISFRAIRKFVRRRGAGARDLKSIKKSSTVKWCVSWPLN